MKKVTGFTLCLLLVASVASAEWHYGIGTGLMRLNAKGDQGLNIAAGDIGPVQLDVDLDPDDFSDLMESAFGLGGYATDGQWMIKYSGGFLNLQGDTSRTLPGGSVVAGEVYLDITSAEASVGYCAHRSENVVVTPYVGVRYTEHEIGAKLSATIGADTSSAERNVDHSWTDARVGVAVDVPLAQTWTWGSSVEAGFGESEGTYVGDTGIAWMFTKHWLGRLGFKYSAIDFENGSKGDSDWYLYDVDEFGASLNVLYNW